MGREVKRVPLDFNYPMNMVWKGYINPYRSIECKPCGGSGSGPNYKQLSDDWYGFDRPSKQWCYDITQDEVQKLFDEGRLTDFKLVPTAAEVNEWAHKGMGHDSINHWICTDVRAKRLGITDHECPTCGGSGGLWADDKYAELSENFKDIEPPKGDGWQMWETTSEGSPMSPVFGAPEELAEWLENTNASSFGRSGASYESWLSMITRGWAPSAVVIDGQVKSGVEACD